MCHVIPFWSCNHTSIIRANQYMKLYRIYNNTSRASSSISSRNKISSSASIGVELERIDFCRKLLRWTPILLFFFSFSFLHAMTLYMKYTSKYMQVKRNMTKLNIYQHLIIQYESYNDKTWPYCKIEIMIRQSCTEKVR